MSIGLATKGLFTAGATSSGGVAVGASLALSPLVFEIPPATATETYVGLVELRNAGILADATGAVTLAITNQSGVDRSGNLVSATLANTGTGLYRFQYQVASTHPAEQLLLTFSLTLGGVAETFTRSITVVNTTASSPDLTASFF